MTTLRLRACVLVAACVFGPVSGERDRVSAQSTAPSSRSDAAAGASDAEQAIRSSAEQFVAAFNNRDAKAVAALWAVDGDFVDEAGERTVGREAIEKRYTESFATDSAATIEIAVEAIRVVGPDTAIEDGTSTVSLGAQAEPIAARYTVVHVRRDGAWQMASVREFTPAAPAAADALDDLDWMIGAWRAEHLGTEVEITCRWLANNSFVEATYAAVVADEKTPTATQIIGVNPGTGRIMSWMFNADGGYAQGDWAPSAGGWTIAYQGVTTDGVPTTSTNLLFRQDDALVWKSTHRLVAGAAMPDTEEVVLKRE